MLNMHELMPILIEIHTILDIKFGALVGRAQLTIIVMDADIIPNSENQGDEVPQDIVDEAEPISSNLSPSNSKEMSTAVHKKFLI